MSACSDWKKYAIHQRSESTGCIPTGYEMLLRAANAQGIDYNTFQDDFDFDKGGGPFSNHFVPVSKEIEKKYPSVKFACEDFKKGKGCDKIHRIEVLMDRKQWVLISLAQNPTGGWHIMPVVHSDTDNLTLLHHVDSGGKIHTETHKKSEIISRHDNWDGGTEISYLVNC